MKCNAKTSEELFLLKSFKYFDLSGNGSLNKEEFIRTLEKLNVFGFSDENIDTLFDCYANSKTKEIDYKSFTKDIFSNHIIKDKIDEVENIIKKLNRKLKELGSQEYVRIFSLFVKEAKDNNIGITPGFIEEMNSLFKLGLKIEEIEKIFYSFYSLNSFDYYEFFNIISGETVQNIKDYYSFCYDVLSKNGVNNVNSLIEAFQSNTEIISDDTFEEYVNCVNLHHRLFSNDKYDTKEESNELKIDMFQEIFKLFNIFIDVNQIEDFVNKSLRISERESENQEKQYKNELQLKEKLWKMKNKEDNQMSLSDAPNLDKKQLQMLDSLKSKLLKLDKFMFVKLFSEFRKLDKNKSKNLTQDEFNKAIKSLNVNFFKTQVSILYSLFEVKEKGIINYELFIRTILDNHDRIQIILKAYKELEKFSLNKVNLSSKLVLKNYNTKEHPDVLDGSLEEENVKNEFMNNLLYFFDSEEGVGKL